MKILKNTLFVILGAVCVAGGVLAWLVVRKPAIAPPSAVKAEMSEAHIARGRFLFTVVCGCDNCHSQLDHSRFGAVVVPGGRGRGGLFPETGLPGTVYAPNITPDPETGLGKWTDGEKIRAIREGVSRDGRALFPLMPYLAFRYMSDEDAESMVAYMNTLPAIHNPVPTTTLQFPVSLLVKGEPQPAGSVKPVDRANKRLYGEYLVTLSSCETCHTYEEKGSLDLSRRFGGGRRFTLAGGPTVVSANISPDVETGIGGWTLQRFLERFQAYRGYVRNGSPEAGPERFTVMPWLQFAQYPDEDLEAVYIYLMSRTPIHNPVEKRTIALLQPELLVWPGVVEAEAK